MDWETILRSLIVLDDNGCFALRSTASGGGSYTFPANHGNVAYVATGGNDGTGAVGNISKPYLTAQAALAAINATIPGTIIILSSTGAQIINDVSYSDGDAPEILTIHDMCSCGITFTGTILFNELYLDTAGTVTVNVDTQWNFDSYARIKCKYFTIPDTMVGAILMTNGLIDCDIFNISENSNASIFIDVINWSKAATIGLIDSFTYNDCTPWEYYAVLRQSGTSAPTAVVNKNSLGETPTYGYTEEGSYTIDSPGSKFIVGNTEVVFGLPLANGDGVPSQLFYPSDPTTSAIAFGVYDYTLFAKGNGLIRDMAINIKIYPEIY